MPQPLQSAGHGVPLHEHVPILDGRVFTRLVVENDNPHRRPPASDRFGRPIALAVAATPAGIGMQPNRRCGG